MLKIILFSLDMEILSNYFNLQVSKPINSTLYKPIYFIRETFAQNNVEKRVSFQIFIRFSPQTILNNIHDGIYRPTDSI